jgi:hypothetical protein
LRGELFILGGFVLTGTVTISSPRPSSQTSSPICWDVISARSETVPPVEDMGLQETDPFPPSIS